MDRVVARDFLVPDGIFGNIDNLLKFGKIHCDLAIFDTLVLGAGLYYSNDGK